MEPGMTLTGVGWPRRLTAHRIAEGPDVRSAGDFVWLASPHAPSLFARRTITSLWLSPGSAEYASLAKERSGRLINRRTQ